MLNSDGRERTVRNPHLKQLGKTSSSINSRLSLAALGLWLQALLQKTPVLLVVLLDGPTPTVLAVSIASEHGAVDNIGVEAAFAIKVSTVLLLVLKICHCNP